MSDEDLIKYKFDIGEKVFINVDYLLTSLIKDYADCRGLEGRVTDRGFGYNGSGYGGRPVDTKTPIPFYTVEFRKSLWKKKVLKITEEHLVSGKRFPGN